MSKDRFWIILKSIPQPFSVCERRDWTCRLHHFSVRRSGTLQGCRLHYLRWCEVGAKCFERSQWSEFLRLTSSHMCLERFSLSLNPSAQALVKFQQAQIISCSSIHMFTKKRCYKSSLSFHHRKMAVIWVRLESVFRIRSGQAESAARAVLRVRSHLQLSNIVCLPYPTCFSQFSIAISQATVPPEGRHRCWTCSRPRPCASTSRPWTVRSRTLQYTIIIFSVLSTFFGYASLYFQLFPASLYFQLFFCSIRVFLEVI